MRWYRFRAWTIHDLETRYAMCRLRPLNMDVQTVLDDFWHPHVLRMHFVDRLFNELDLIVG